MKFAIQKKHFICYMLIFFAFMVIGNPTVPSLPTQAKPTLDVQDSYADTMSKLFDGNSNNQKLDKKWKKALAKRMKKSKEYNENKRKHPHVLYAIKSKEKNLDMAYVNTKPITSKKVIATSLTKEDIDNKNRKMREKIKKFYTANKIENCKNNFSEVIANPVKDDFEDDEVLDYLILQKDILKNIDKNKIINQDFFGYKNTVYFYSQEFLDMFSLSLKKKKIKCLPLRIIVTKNNIYRYYGLDALKYYDYKKNGIFHHWVKKHLNLFIG